MIELVRIVNQATLSSYRATQNEERALQLELLIEATKPTNHFSHWHPLIAESFRYNPPHLYIARFRPAYGRNVFYGTLIEETALYEQAFHFMQQRVNLPVGTETGARTIFFVAADDKNAVHIKKHNDFPAIIDKKDYSASHQFVTANPDATFIFYPSCRDPQQRDNAAVLDINHLEKNPSWEASIKFFYDNDKKQMTWIDYNLHIQWNQVA